MGYQKALNLLFLSLIYCSSAFCKDFISFKEILSKTEAVLKNQQSDYFEKTVKRMGNRKISLEAFISMEADWNTLKKTAQKVSDFPIWALPNINNRGSGETFYIQITGMQAESSNPNNIILQLVLALPAIKIPISRIFHFDFPSIEDKNIFSMKITTLQAADSPVENLSGYFHFFRNPQNPNRVWVYLDVSVVLTHWLVYESLPERLLSRESGERIRILIENYQSFENTKR